MRIECEICGAYTEDPNEIEWAKKYRICPECRHIGSLFITEEDESMKEYNIDLVIDKTFNVFADSLEEAKEKAIMNARQLMDSYNSLTIDRIEVVEELEWDNEYDVRIVSAKGNEYNYGIEADDDYSAEMVAREFFADDYPDEMIQTIEVHIVEEENE